MTSAMLIVFLGILLSPTIFIVILVFGTLKIHVNKVSFLYRLLVPFHTYGKLVNWYRKAFYSNLGD